MGMKHTGHSVCGLLDTVLNPALKLKVMCIILVDQVQGERNLITQYLLTILMLLGTVYYVFHLLCVMQTKLQDKRGLGVRLTTIVYLGSWKPCLC